MAGAVRYVYGQENVSGQMSTATVFGPECNKAQDGPRDRRAAPGSRRRVAAPQPSGHRRENEVGISFTTPRRLIASAGARVRGAELERVPAVPVELWRCRRPRGCSTTMLCFCRRLISRLKELDAALPPVFVRSRLWTVVPLARWRTTLQSAEADSLCATESSERGIVYGNFVRERAVTPSFMSNGIACCFDGRRCH